MTGILIIRNFYDQMMICIVSLQNSLPVLHQQIIDDSSGHLSYLGAERNQYLEDNL